MKLFEKAQESHSEKIEFLWVAEGAQVSINDASKGPGDYDHVVYLFRPLEWRG